MPRTAVSALLSLASFEIANCQFHLHYDAWSWAARARAVGAEETTVKKDLQFHDELSQGCEYYVQ